MKKLSLLIISLFLICYNLNSIELIATKDLLASYLERDSDLKKLTIELQKVKLTYESVKIERGFDIQLSTGTMTFRLGADDVFSVNPSLSVNLPQYSNLGIKVGSKVNVNTNEETGSGVSDTSINLSMDILSSSKDERNIAFLKAERSILEAERALAKKALEKEQTFYRNLSRLLSEVSSIISAQQDYYDDKISFEKIKAQGYAKTSSTYRRAEMQVLGDEHDIESDERNLFNDYKIFYLECGQNLDLADLNDYIELIPSDIEIVQPLNVHDFSPDDYAETEKAIWTNKINQMTRDAAKDYSLAASAGYTLANSKTNSDTVGIGLEGTYGGVGANLNLDFPLASDNSNPAITMGITVKPNTFKKNQISAQLEELSAEEEKIAIDNSRINFATAAKEKDLELESVLWEQSTNSQNLELYKSLAEDMFKWYKQGIVTESEYLAAKINMQKSSVSQIVNSINMIIYNSEIKSMFVDSQNK